jgi:hypothetical protein
MLTCCDGPVFRCLRARFGLLGQIMGTTVIGGMVAATAIAIFRLLGKSGLRVAEAALGIGSAELLQESIRNSGVECIHLDDAFHPRSLLTEHFLLLSRQKPRSSNQTNLRNRGSGRR